MAPISPQAISARLKALRVRVLRGQLLRYVRGAPREEDRAGADRRVFIVMWTAWGMGGTIRAAFNLAEYLAERGYEVEIISGIRDRDVPFFGAFPAGVRVSSLDDRRPGGGPRGLAGLLRRLLRRRTSMLMPIVDRAITGFNLWTDIELARKLRGRSGFLLGTRPGVNIMLGRLRAPGLTAVGLEQMNFGSHDRPVRKAIRRRYGTLDALVVLTDADADVYRERLDGSTPPLYRIPNTVRPLPGAKADLASRTIYTAGRLRKQKGFDLLIPAFAPVAERHPEWRLRVRGEGYQQELLEELVEQHGLAGSVSLEGPAEDVGADMADASIFVLSSRFEGFPLILLEAMSKGMGVVAFDCPTGPSEIIDDHENGILVPAQDVDALSRGILELVEDAELRSRTAAAAVETAQHFTIEEIGPRWEALFRELSRSR